MTPDPRLDHLRKWLATDLGLDVVKLAPASADASFRRYFRIWLPDGGTRIVMDAPPQHEDLAGYLRVSRLLEHSAVHVPQVHAHDTTLGLALLEDLGSTHMLTALHSGADPEALYDAALDELAALQLRGDTASRQLPPYDRAVLLREMQLLPEWFCRRHLQLELDAAEVRLIEETFEFLIGAALEQPLVFVHRDYHSRNLMIVPDRSPGVIDFQDALRGPVAYDLASILKDCYVAWPRARVEHWVAQFRQRLIHGGAVGAALAGNSEAQFLRWFDLIGLQRHLKVLGIFARLKWRDGKSGYLADLPRTLEYVREAAAVYPELRAFGAFVERRLVPALPAANKRALDAVQTKVMLLAAGRGERMRPLTDHQPKPLLEVAGKPLIAWHLERLVQAGFREVVINVSWLGEQIVAALGDGSSHGVRIAWSREPWPALETGGGLVNALPLLGENAFLLVNSDVYTDIDFASLRIAPADLAQLVLVPNPAHHMQGDFWLDGSGRIGTEVGERLTYSGIALLRPELFAGAEPGRFPLLPWLLKARDAGRLGGQKHVGRWLDVGTPERLRELDAQLGNATMSHL